MEEIFGYVENVVFAGEGFTVARLKEPRKHGLTCIVGALPALQPGETVRCMGSWKHHPQYGQQFEVQTFESREPSDLIGIQKYLESGMIKGIGPTYAERIVKKFGLETLKIIDDAPERLREVPGVGTKRIETICFYWKQQKSVREVMIFLQSHGISPIFAQKIFKTYGDQSVEKVKQDPYILARDIRGIGFKFADKIALQMGVPLHSLTRIQAGIEHALWELSNEGHTCFPKEQLIMQSAEMLAIPLPEITQGLERGVASGAVIEESGFIALKPFYLAEKGIGRELGRLESSPCSLRSVIVEKAVVWAEEKCKRVFTDEQKIAIGKAVQDKIHIITGPPGTGKTTTLQAILWITGKLTDSILLAAPTGRAAKRMAETTGKRASTIHALLEMDFASGGFKRQADNPLKCDLIVIDEASMIDTFLFFHLLKAIPSTARFILIGDVDQLPSVGAGNVLKDLINSDRIGVTRLTQIVRQAAHSKIVTNAYRINQGEFPELLSFSDFQFVEASTPQAIIDSIIHLVTEKLSQKLNPFDEIQLISPMNRGVVGTANLNVVLQNALNPSPTPLCRMGRTFHVGDKVMQIRNDYEKLIFNGDIGKITTIDLSNQTLTVLFDHRHIDYQFSEIDDLVLAYAISVHKSQGGEYRCVIVVLDMSHAPMLMRNLLYTAITRGKKLVILVGTKQAIGFAIQNDDVKKRHTFLKEAIRPVASAPSASLLAR